MINERIIILCREGNKKAQQTLYKAFASQMFVHCFRYIKHKEDAEEVMSDAFIKVFKNLKDFEYKGGRSFEAWVKRIMINECLMFLRKRKVIFFEEGEALKHDSLQASNVALSKLEATDIYKLVLGLPVGYRTVFNLYAIEGYSHKEIAQSLGISESTSRSQLTKARVMLKEKITGATGIK